MGKYDLMDELTRVTGANVLFSERKANVMEHSLGDLREGLYQAAEYFSTVVVPNDKYGVADFWDWRNDANEDTTLDINVVSYVFSEAEYSLAYKLEMVGAMTEDEIRNYFLDQCEITGSTAEL